MARRVILKTMGLVVLGTLAAVTLFAVESDTVTLNLVAKGKVFTPSELIAPAGKRIEIMIKNEGPAAEEFDSKDLKREKVIPEGQTVKVTIGVLKTGTYNFVGEFRGAKGVLKVADATSFTPPAADPSAPPLKEASPVEKKSKDSLKKSPKASKPLPPFKVNN